jgi:Tify domain binding domain
MLFQAVSPLDFELHANSMKKHPSKYIYLENGNNLHAVMKMCTEVPLDMLESAIQEAVGMVTQQKAATCTNCKGVNSILTQPATFSAATSMLPEWPCSNEISHF